jgi:hypothetical protein
MSEFKIPPISTLIGSNLINFIRVLRNGGSLDGKYYFKLLLTTLVVLISTPFHWWEEIMFRRRIRKFNFKKDPVFILGHWRSGTTFLHNMLCVDPDSGFLTTYQSVFPNNLASKFIYRNFMKMNMPDKRPSDNVKLGIDLPQEDEFALGNLTDRSFYHFFYFPKFYKKYYSQSVDDVNAEKAPSWDRKYRELVIKALLNSGGSRAILKNPVNTGRIKTLLRIFPNAKFIYIYREPVTVYLSTRKFFIELFPTLWFHKVAPEFIENMIFENFRLMIQNYESNKHLIPVENLMEVKFEELEKDPMHFCEEIYSKLYKENFNTKRIYFARFLAEQKGYTKNNYKVPSEISSRVDSEWGDITSKWGY